MQLHQGSFVPLFNLGRGKYSPFLKVVLARRYKWNRTTLMFDGLISHSVRPCPYYSHNQTRMTHAQHTLSSRLCFVSMMPIVIYWNTLTIIIEYLRLPCTPSPLLLHSLGYTMWILVIGRTNPCVQWSDRFRQGKRLELIYAQHLVSAQELGRSAAGEKNTKKDHGVCGDGFTALASTALNQSSGSTSWTPGQLNQGISIQPGSFSHKHEVIQTFDEEQAVAITEANTAISCSSVSADLAYLKSNFGNLPGAITALEVRDSALVKAVKIMRGIKENLNQASGAVGTAIVDKFNRVLQ
uniref:(California timema) hypothetical protein n=1 Tax=Timema californicum TaxID=61474 RepID=A0A7R9J0N0_TIMCA|nr:unnamed protein product [Timema californicum]